LNCQRPDREPSRLAARTLENVVGKLAAHRCWAAAASRLERRSREVHGDAQRPPPLVHATYRSVRNGYGLSDHQGRECVVYAVEQRSGDHGLHVPSRCGVRFVGDDSYWVVPAMELDIGPLAVAG